MQNEKVPAAMQDNVTQAEKAWHRHERSPYAKSAAEDEKHAFMCGFQAAHRLASTTAQSEAVQKLVDAAEDKAWREARELVRGTNADLCKTGEQAYRIIQKGITDAVNNRNLRTLKGRVAAHRESQP